MMFATLVIEREPPRWADLPAGAESWLQDVGGFAAVGLVIWILAYLLRRSPSASIEDQRPWLVRGFVLAASIALVAYVAAGALKLHADQQAAVVPGVEAPPVTDEATARWISRLLTMGGAAALLAVALPFLFDLGKLRWRRIWAISVLSMREAVRRRVLWAFVVLLLIPLFGSWFIDSKPENQVRNYVNLLYFGMTILFLIAASLMAALSIPADVKSQTIHTIVTKPVERFEIVLGRFLGYTLLMTFVLAITTALGLLYLVREIDPDARFESLRARVPVFGELAIYPKSTPVGYEWEYRHFIPGGPTAPHRAIWSFRDLPASLATRQEPVPCEFSFEIFRTTKGQENIGVFCSFAFQTWRWDPSLAGKYAEERQDLLKKADPRSVDAQLAEKYGFYEIRSKEVADYHTLAMEVPATLFKNALQDTANRPTFTTSQGLTERVPEMQVLVKCESPTQYIGVAKRDFYLLDHERTFAENFFKGAAGLWLRLCLVIGLAVACSTYLSGVIAWLATMFIYGLGFFEEFIRNLAFGTSVGGGPMESLMRLVNRSNLVSPLDETPGAQFAMGSDVFFRWGLRRVLDIIPDVDQYDFTHYVAEGFNIALGQQLLLSLVMLLGYLLPWAILSFYLIKSREVAS